MAAMTLQVFAAVGAITVVTACSGSSGTTQPSSAAPRTPGAGPSSAPLPAPETVALRPIAAPPIPSYRPTQFVARVDNPYLPLLPGARWVYRGKEDGIPTRDVVTVTPRHRLIDGVRCEVVSDKVFTAGRLTEPTRDYYAEDHAGNVWYFGEDTAELDKAGRVRTRSGSWLAGRNGGHAGIIMPADPVAGQEGQQEYRTGVAADRFRVTQIGALVSAPAIGQKAALVTLEWSPLEPRVFEQKYYVRGIGDVVERTLRGGREHQHLVSYSPGT